MNQFAKPGLAEEKLPPVSSADNGKVLGVNNGVWDKVAASGGTTVVANPTLAGTEADLTGLQVGDTKYKVPEGGGGGAFVVTVDDDTGALDKTWREIYTAAQSSVVIFLGLDPDNPGTINANYFNSTRVGTGVYEGYYYVRFGDLTGELFELRANSADGYPAFYD